MKEGDTVNIGGEEWDVVSAYSRQQAIDDGVLVDISKIAPDLVKEAGIVYPVAMTTTVWSECVEVPEGLVGQDWKGRLWDILFLFRLSAKRSQGSEFLFKVNVLNDTKRTTTVTLKAHCGPGDDAEPVITIMGETED